MKTRQARAFAVAAALTGSSIGFPAAAQQRVDTVQYTGPDRGLLGTGAWTLGLSYAPALVVGSASSLPEDRYLLAPVAGPWLDYAKRNCKDCAHEPANRVMLITDGLLQGVGAFEILGAFVLVERSEVTQPGQQNASPKGFNLHFVPVRVSGGYGLKAFGKF